VKNENQNTAAAPDSVSVKRKASLLTARRFGPFFWTQFSGTFNDNLFKTALAILLVYQLPKSSHLMVNLAAGLFILPFILFSSLAGQVADRNEKARLIRRIKLAEVVLMTGAAVCLLVNQITGLFVLLFLMGTQSAFFGPVKYSLMPQHLKRGELVRANGLVQMGTCVAILVGTMVGGAGIAAENGRMLVAAGILITAVAGWLISRQIPKAPAAEPTLRMRWNIIAQTRKTISLAAADRPRLLGMLGISWFWFLGSAYVTQLPAFVRQVLHGEPGVVTLLLGAFSIGVAAGSLVCGRISGKRLETGLIPLASLGMSLFGWDLSVLSPPVGPVGAFGLLGSIAGWRVLLDFALIGMSGGIYIVPLLTLVQMRSPGRIRSRVIAANNILNAGFMVVSAILSAVLLSGIGISLQGYFLLLAAANLGVGFYICWKVPRSVLRLGLSGLIRMVYRLRCQGLERLPESGPALLVCNHVSYIDALIISAAFHRPIRFVMHQRFFQLPALHWFFKLTRMIPIDSARNNPALLRRALEQIDTALKNSELVCLFPEGRLTRDGDISRFRPGVEKIVQRRPVPVVPLALRGLWGSFFSHKDGRAFSRWPRRFNSCIELSVGPLLPPHRVTADGLMSVVSELRGATP
jgi:1-acyl-sn-glycerol-3-phosphate acyltransferase